MCLMFSTALPQHWLSEPPFGAKSRASKVLPIQPLQPVSCTYLWTCTMCDIERVMSDIAKFDPFSHWGTTTLCHELRICVTKAWQLHLHHRSSHLMFQNVVCLFGQWGTWLTAVSAKCTATVVFPHPGLTEAYIILLWPSSIPATACNWTEMTHDNSLSWFDK